MTPLMSAADLLRLAREAEPPEAHRHARADVRQRDGATGPEGERADMEIVVSTEGLARDGGIVPTDAWDLDAFRRNPVVMLAHGRGFPIARAEWTTPDRSLGELRQGWTFHRENEESELAATLYAGGFMRSASVGFRLLDHHQPDGAELDEWRDELGLGEDEEILWVADAAELLEASAVAVPADPGALAPLDRALSSARAQGLDVEPLSRCLRELRRACNDGDASACRKLEDRRPDPDVARLTLHGLAVRILTYRDGRRELVLPTDDGEKAVKLHDGEDAEDALAALLADGAERAARRPSAFRSSTAARHRGSLRPDARFR